MNEPFLERGASRFLLLRSQVPEDKPELAALITKIQIPTALITKEAGDKIKAALARAGAGPVSLELDWSESLAHPDARVEWELWWVQLRPWSASRSRNRPRNQPINQQTTH
jgi:hypothetical protein